LKRNLFRRNYIFRNRILDNSTSAHEDFRCIDSRIHQIECNTTGSPEIELIILIRNLFLSTASCYLCYPTYVTLCYNEVRWHGFYNVSSCRTDRVGVTAMSC